ncbi:hypothetical protein [Actinopolyspora halophila]|uniref:hypothetical protein n=1 Tax=Actinopolyspora halophila TaxID=1850 RepID=UPI00037C7330|nr:hypothetical protein [Actinopolyspora halophila]
MTTTDLDITTTASGQRTPLHVPIQHVHTDAGRYQAEQLTVLMARLDGWCHTHHHYRIFARAVLEQLRGER